METRPDTNLEYIQKLSALKPKLAAYRKVRYLCITESDGYRRHSPVWITCQTRAMLATYALFPSDLTIGEAIDQYDAVIVDHETTPPEALERALLTHRPIAEVGSLSVIIRKP